MGNYHFQHEINPVYFDKNCFNFSINSQSVYYNWFILNKYINKLPKLQYVIVPISYPTLTDKLEDGIEYWRKYRYIHYMNYDNLKLKEKFSLNTYLAISQGSGISIFK